MNLKKIFISFALALSTFSLAAIPFDQLDELCPDCYLIPGFSDDQEVLIGCHGFGMDAQIIDFLEIQEFAPHHLVSFNFPNYGHGVNDQPAEELKFGTIWELEPLLRTLKACVIDGNQDRVHLYGFSAGGGAVVNTLAVLWHYRFGEHLVEFGIGIEERDRIITAIKKGTITLDLPMKSVDEVIIAHPEEATDNLLSAAQNYIDNDLRPIDTLKKLEGMELNILLHFQAHDRILTNRDDDLYCERLMHANKGGLTHIVIGTEGIHAPCLLTVLEAYRECFPQYFNENN
jgi:hypothetical protein